MADKKKFPNPEFFRAKTEMDWKAQAANLKEFGSIALDLIKETDWKAFGRKQKEHFLDNMNRVAREAKTVAAMTCAERKDLLLNGEKHLGALYRKGDMATVRREWRGVESTLVDFSGWLKVWGMLLATFSKDLIPELRDGEEALPQICMHIMQHSECARYIADEKVQQRRETADRLAREYHADGIIYEQMKYCDYWGFERALVSHIMHEEYDWPVLSIDRLYNNGNSGQLRTRVQAFVESLEIKKLHKQNGGAN